MHTQSIVALALVAAASVVVAEAENRPRIYFPRQVKRVYTNTTIPITSPASQSSHAAILTTTSTTKRDGISDLLGSLGLGLGLGGDSTKDDGDTTTVVVPTTVYISPSPTGTGSKNDSDSDTTPATKHTASTTKDDVTTTKPPLLSLPTIDLGGDLSSILNPLNPGGHSDSSTASSGQNATASDSKPTDTATSSGILLFPTGAVTTTAKPTPTSSSGGGLLDGLTSLLLPGPQSSDTTDDATETSSKGTATKASTTADVTPTSKSGGLGGGLISVITDLLPGPTTNSTEPTATPTPTGTGTRTKAPTTTPAPTNNGGGGLISVITDLLPGPTSNSTEPIATPTSTPKTSSGGGILPTSLPLTSLLPTSIIPIPTPTPTPSGNGTDVTVTPTESASVPVTLPPTSTPIANGTSIIPPTGTGSPTTLLPSSSQIPSNMTTVIPTSTPVPGPSSSTILIPQNTTMAISSTPTPTGSGPLSSFSSPASFSSSPSPSSSSSTSTLIPTTSAPAIPTPTTTSTSSREPVTSIQATATITDSQSWLPTSLIIQSPTGTVSTGGLPSTATGLPTTLPMAISPGTSTGPQPPDSTPIQISFSYGLHYMHLVQQPKAAAQLFQYLPQALAYASGIEEKDISMFSIRPYDTLSTLGYITSQALLYYPTDKVNQLADDVKTPNSALYNQVDALCGNLTSQINSAIPIWLGAGLDGSTSSSDGGDSSSDGGSGGRDAFGGSSGNETTSAQRGTTAGIAVGALSVAGAYGAAMFIIARRYKRKKQRHQRSSSLSAVDEMRQTGSPAMMGGALLSRDFSGSPGYSYGATPSGNMRDSQGSGRSGTNHSARTANISAPVAAENSLGWN